MSSPNYELVRQLEQVEDDEDVELDAPAAELDDDDDSALKRPPPSTNIIYYAYASEDPNWRCRFVCTIIPMFFLVGYYVGGFWTGGANGSTTTAENRGSPVPVYTTTTTSTIATPPAMTTTPATSTSTTAAATTTTTLNAEDASLPASTLKLKQQLESCRADHNQKCFMFSMKDSGLGSQLINLFVNQIYLQQVYGYTTMLVDCMAYEGYQRPDGEPVLTGYFTVPDLAVLNYESELDEYVIPLLPAGFDLPAYDTLDYKARESHVYKDLVVQPDATTTDADLVVVSHLMFHTEARNWVKNSGFGGYKALYRALVERMCPQLQFNSAAQQDMLELRHGQYPDLPDDLRAPATKEVSVAFHVRRTDKLTSGESEMFHSSQYIHQAVQALELDHIALEQVTICFLATDDNAVHAEMQQALTEAGLTCRLVFTPPSKMTTAKQNDTAAAALNPGALEKRYETDAAMVFLTEFGILLEATYFVGTFGSNVGSLAAVLRACPGGYDGNKNYAQTYGVDRPKWYFR